MSLVSDAGGVAGLDGPARSREGDRRRRSFVRPARGERPHPR